MKTLRLYLSLPTFVAAGGAGCSTTRSAKSIDVTGSIQTSLDQAGFKDVTARRDRDKGVVTLGGHVTSDSDKSQAESLARSFAGEQVVANEIAVMPRGAEGELRKVNADLDKGIESNLDAALVVSKLHERVKFAAENGVVTLMGDVDPQANRGRAEQVASSVPNVQQVVTNFK